MSLIRKHVAVLQAWACLALVTRVVTSSEAKRQRRLCIGVSRYLSIGLFTTGNYYGRIFDEILGGAERGPRRDIKVATRILLSILDHSLSRIPFHWKTTPMVSSWYSPGGSTILGGGLRYLVVSSSVVSTAM